MKSFYLATNRKVYKIGATTLSNPRIRMKALTYQGYNEKVELIDYFETYINPFILEKIFITLCTNYRIYSETFEIKPCIKSMFNTFKQIYSVEAIEGFFKDLYNDSDYDHIFLSQKNYLTDSFNLIKDAYENHKNYYYSFDKLSRLNSNLSRESNSFFCWLNDKRKLI